MNKLRFGIGMILCIFISSCTVHEVSSEQVSDRYGAKEIKKEWGYLIRRYRERISDEVYKIFDGIPNGELTYSMYQMSNNIRACWNMKNTDAEYIEVNTEWRGSYFNTVIEMMSLDPVWGIHRSHEITNTKIIQDSFGNADIYFSVYYVSEETKIRVKIDEHIPNTEGLEGFKLYKLVRKIAKHKHTSWWYWSDDDNIPYVQYLYLKENNNKTFIISIGGKIDKGYFILDKDRVKIFPKHNWDGSVNIPEIAKSTIQNADVVFLNKFNKELNADIFAISRGSKIFKSYAGLVYSFGLSDYNSKPYASFLTNNYGTSGEKYNQLMAFATNFCGQSNRIAIVSADVDDNKTNFTLAETMMMTYQDGILSEIPIERVKIIFGYTNSNSQQEQYGILSSSIKMDNKTPKIIKIKWNDQQVIDLKNWWYWTTIRPSTDMYLLMIDDTEKQDKIYYYLRSVKTTDNIPTFILKENSSLIRAHFVMPSKNFNASDLHNTKLSFANGGV